MVVGISLFATYLAVEANIQATDQGIFAPKSQHKYISRQAASTTTTSAKGDLQ